MSATLPDGSPSFDAEVFLVSAGAAAEGHNARYLSRIAQRLRYNGIDVHAVVPSGAALVDGVTTIPVDTGIAPTDAARFRKFGHAAPLARGIVRLRSSRVFLQRAVALAAQMSAASGRPAIIHLLDYEYLTASAVLRQIGRTQGLESVVTVHPSNFVQRGWGLGAIYKRAILSPFRSALKSVRAVVCHGPWIRDRLIEQLNLAPGCVHALDYPSEGRDARVPKAQARDALGLRGDLPVVLWFGMIRKNKRLDLAAAAIARLSTEVQFVVAGRPAELTAEDIHRLLQEHGVESNTMTHLDYIAEADIPLYFSAADVLLATHDPSFTSASGPISDARTYRLPVVATQTGQLAEYVTRFGVGVVPEVNDPRGFADALTVALETDAQAWEAVLESAAQELSWERFADAHQKIYQALLRET